MSQYCQLCERGFPLKGAFHIPTQALGMIPVTRCKAVPSKTTDPEVTYFSKADLDAYQRMPSGWFVVGDLSFMIRNPRWRCDRLVGLKALESEVLSTPTIHTRYRKLPLR